jgi:FAD dependent oxidoreductase TIGR03364
VSSSADVVVVGAGIVGLAHALTAARRGKRVTVIERDHRAIGASIRNFGFITVTGQPAGDTWRRARRSRDIWDEIAAQAGIPILHRGLWVLARRPRARQVLEAYMRTAMADGLWLGEAREAAGRAPMLRTEGASAAMYSPLEVRVESREAIPRLAAWLAERYTVRFHFGEAVLEVEAPRVRTARRTIHAERVILCPGTELNGVGAQALAPWRLRLSRLQMLRIRPPVGWAMDAAVMSDLSLVRYGGYAALAESKPLLEQLQSERGEHLQHGIHLIAVRSADGTLVVGDSHHEFDTPPPFASEQVDELILDALREAIVVPTLQIVERWTGVYPVGGPGDCLIEKPDTATRVVVVTSGTGASTAFGIAEEVFDEW